ncbi:MAG: thiamine pyrophosphate-binding protein [Flavobacteriaceae bacterium]
MAVTGGILVAQAIKKAGIDTFFFIMGAPMLQSESTALKLGLRGIDVRHEQAAVMAAQAYCRLRNRPAACMAASGPGTTNLVTGAAHAMLDCVPVLLLGGSSPQDQSGREPFQEMDQLAMMRPCVKWADRVHHAERVPEFIDRALHIATSGKPGPVYLDLPADMLMTEVDEDGVVWPATPFNVEDRPRPALEPAKIDAILAELARARQPVIVTGGGALWSGAGAELQTFVEKTGIPFYATPQGRGIVPDDHDLSFLSARSTAFREADLVLVLGTRMNYVFGHMAPPRFRADARIVRIDIEPREIAVSQRLAIGAVADLRTALGQLNAALAAAKAPDYTAWTDRLRKKDVEKTTASAEQGGNNGVPIHPARLCEEVRDFARRDGVLVVDGQEILNFGRQIIPSYKPGHRQNSGTFGTMGVGMPFGVGAKAACPDKEVIVLHGDGSFGMNAMEFDTAVRHKLPVIVIISLNGGWTGDPDHSRPGRDLGYTRFDKMAEAFGGHGEFVENPEDIRPALERARAANAEGRPALVNVVTDWRVKSTTFAFTRYTT